MDSKGGSGKILAIALMVVGGLVFVCVALIALAYIFPLSLETAVTQTPLRVGEPAPDFRLVASAGGEHQLNSYRGKVVLLNFWTTWCGPCEAEMPSIERLSAQYAPEDVAVLAINNEESAAKVADYRNRLDITFPLLLDAYGDVSDLYRVHAFPTSILVDREGVIRQIHIGSMGEDEFIQMIEEALAEPPGME